MNSFEDQMDQALNALVEKHVHSAISKALPKAASGRPTGLSLPGNRIESTDDGPNLGEFLWLMAGTVNSQDHGRREFSQRRLGEKYKAFRPVENFDREWNKSALAQGGDVAKAATDMLETQGAIGGFAVPVEFSSQLFSLASERAILMPRVRKYPMTSNELIVPTLDYTKGGSGASPYLAGMIASWGAEGAPFVQTNANLKEISLKANLLSGYTRVSRTLLADNMVALQTVLTDLIAETIAFYVDLAIFNGSGLNQPMGMFNPTGPALKTTGTVTVASGTLLKDLSNMESHLLPGSDNNAIWLASPSMKNFIYTLSDTTGRVVWLPSFPVNIGGPAAVTPPMTLFGKPLFFSQLPTAIASGTTMGTNNIVLCDPRFMLFGLRKEIEIGVSEHESWLSNKLTWRFLFRGDSRPALNTFVTLQNNDQVSPFVYWSAT